MSEGGVSWVKFKETPGRAGRLTDPEDLHWIKWVLEAKDCAYKDESQSGDRGGELKRKEVLDVVEYSFAFFDGAENG